VPPRQAWNQDTGRSSPQLPPPLRIPGASSSPRPLRTPTGDRPNYYEDVDARFADPAPATLQPGSAADPAYDDSQSAGARSPAPSEQSAFTSISQRGINPRYQPPAPQPNYGQYPPRRPVNRNDVNILNSNPDFMLPGRGGAPNRGGNGGAGAPNSMVPGGAYPGL
jgi:hypothetical protein